MRKFVVGFVAALFFLPAMATMDAGARVLPEPRTARGARDPRLAPGSTLLAANVCIASIERAMGRVRRPFVARDPIFYPKFV